MAQPAARRVRVVASAAEPHRRRPPIRWVLVIVTTAVVAFAIGAATTGTRRVTDAVPAGTGPTRSLAGIPVGFSHDRAGAVAALLNYGATLSDPRVLLDQRRRAQVLSLVATARYAATFNGRAGSAFKRAEGSPLGRGLATGARTAYFATPIAYRVTAYTPDRATVEGWGVAVIGNDRGVKPQATWGTTVASAVWERGDWKIDAVQSINGPTPTNAPAHTASAPADFVARLGGFSGVRHAP
jgi:hypothetical protein